DRGLCDGRLAGEVWRQRGADSHLRRERNRLPEGPRAQHSRARRLDGPVQSRFKLEGRRVARSDASVPFVAAVLPEAAAAARDLGEAVDRLDAHDVFGHLVAELALEPEPQGGAVLDLERRVVHLVGEDRLRMKGVDEPDRLVVAAGVVERLLERVGAEEGDVSRLALEPRGVEQRREFRALPLADAAPALDTVVAGDLRARSERAQV